jgi:UMF1 family MFS transporter
MSLFDTPFAHERLSGPLSAVWLVAFSLPFIFFTSDRASSGLSVIGAIGKGLGQLGRTITQITHYRNVATFLVVRAIYADGMSAVFISAEYLAGPQRRSAFLRSSF